MAKILMIDDSSAMRQLATLTLKSKGHQVEEAADGKLGLDKALADSFDLIITDRNMPNMDGIQMSKALREQANYRFTPILMLTTESDKEKKMEGKQAGVTGWIVKPFNPETLLKTVEKVLA